MKKLMALAVGFLLIGLAFAVAQEKTQEQAQAKAQVKAQLKARTKTQAKAQTKAEFQYRNETRFVDENGDGINDLAKDADGDGIPNGQDPDWTKPLDGTGYKEQNRVGRSDGTGAVQGQKAGKITKSNFGKGSFRTGMTAAGRTTGTGVCDGTGPKGTIKRKGRG
jgi:type II secretory pathway pseudopilin PulG